MTIHPLEPLRPIREVKSFQDVSDALRRVWDVIYSIRRGKLECVAEITLTPGAASTVFERQGLSPQTVIDFDPLTANAAVEKAAGTLFVTLANRQKNQFTISHANNAQADRSFLVSLIG
jgi:hypothetical protein